LDKICPKDPQEKVERDKMFVNTVYANLSTLNNYFKLHIIYTSSQRTTWSDIIFMSLIMKHKQQYAVLLERHRPYVISNAWSNIQNEGIIVTL
jgi:ERCC4-type nuclease